MQEYDHFVGCATLEEAKKRKKKMNIELHPDKNGGDATPVALVNAEFDRIVKQNIWPVPPKVNLFNIPFSTTPPQSDQWDDLYMRQQAAKQARNKTNGKTADDINKENRRKNPFERNDNSQQFTSVIGRYLKLYFEELPNNKYSFGIHYTLTAKETTELINQTIKEFGNNAGYSKLKWVFDEIQQQKKDNKEDFITRKRREKESWDNGVDPDKSKQPRNSVEELRNKIYEYPVTEGDAFKISIREEEQTEFSPGIAGTIERIQYFFKNRK